MQSTSYKIKTLPEILAIARSLKEQGLCVVATNGCFDLLHPGHVENFEWCRAQGDVLIVGINSDQSVKENKGPKRPVVGERDRARVLAGLAAIDYVFIFEEKSPARWIAELRPNIHVKGAGSDLSPYFAGEKKIVEDAGGEMRLAPMYEDRSTTGIIEAVLKLNSQQSNA